MSQADVKPSVGDDVKPYPFPVAEEEEEELEISPRLGAGYVWAVKVPRFLLERWERVPEVGVELGTLVVDNSSADRPLLFLNKLMSHSAVPPKITLRLPTSDSHPPTPADDAMNGQPIAGPSQRKYDTTNIPDEYEVYVPDERAKNTYVFTERIRAWGPMSRGGVIGGGKKRREKGKCYLAQDERLVNSKGCSVGT